MIHKIKCTILCAIIFFSCSKENDFVKTSGSDTNTSSDVELSLSPNKPQNRVLDDSMITEIGRVHNQILEEALTTIDWISPDLEMEVNEFFMNYPNSLIEDVIKNRSDILEVVNDPEQYLSTNTNPEVYKMLNDCKQIFLKVSNYIDLQIELDILREQAQNRFVGIDLDVCLLCFEVLEQSAYFWMPVSVGGGGIGDNFIKIITIEKNLPVAINWRAIAWADGVGAASALLRTWYLAGFGPLSWWAIVGAIGWGAAFSSGIEVLYQLM